MKNRILVITFVLITSVTACEQTASVVQPQKAMTQKSEWNWGNNWEKEKEHNVMMHDSFKFSEYEKALWHFEWLIVENPRIHPKVYETGIAIYDGLISETEDELEKAFLTKEKDKITKLKNKLFPKSQAHSI